MLCPKCGTTMPDGAKLCISCQHLGTVPGAAISAPDEITYAGFWERFAALIVDGFVLFVVNMVFSVLAAISIPLLGGKGDSGAGLGILVVAIYLLPWLFSAAYFSLMESGERGATLGKRLLKLRVVGSSGNRISKGRAVGRWFAHAVSNITLLIGYLIQPFTEKKQALHDMISGTFVVRTEKGSNTAAIVIAFVAMLFFFVVIVGILAAVAIPAYQDYITKSKSYGAEAIGRQATLAVEMYYTQNGRIPASLAETGTQIQLPPYLSAVEVNPENGEVLVTFNGTVSSSMANKSLVFTPSQAQDGRITWKCHSEDIRPALLPQTCR
jgi:uncharacterized RDD family membrane protein YckC/Tfp pilus assembly protein PilE